MPPAWPEAGADGSEAEAEPDESSSYAVLYGSEESRSSYRQPAARHAESAFDRVFNLRSPVWRRDASEPAIGGRVIGRHTILQRLGRGGCSTVYLTREDGTGRRGALKAIAKDEWPAGHAARLAGWEIAGLSHLTHPAVVQLFEVIVTPGHVMLLLEYVGPQNLYEAIGSTSHLRFAPARAQLLFGQLASTIAYCHARGLVHRDLKLENAVLSADGLTIKIVDFSAVGTRSAAFEHLGTVPFMAPEVIARRAQHYDAAKADIWALGMLLFEMLCGLNCIPLTLGWPVPCSPSAALAAELEGFLADRSRLSSLMEWEVLHPPVNRHLHALVHHMLSLSVQQRWAASAVVRSPWLTQVWAA